MPSPSPGYAITMRVAARAGFNATSKLAAATASVGAEITALDVVESTHENVVVNITCIPAKRLVADLCLDDDFTDFLTLPAYELVI